MANFTPIYTSHSGPKSTGNVKILTPDLGNWAVSAGYGKCSCFSRIDFSRNSYLI